MFDEPASARLEAERLVATVLAAASVAANAHPDWSTGSAECCVCPLCKVIAAMRDPDPQFVERFASGAGDLAAGLASFMRNVSAGGAPKAADTVPTGQPGDSWAQATAEAAEAPAGPAATPAKKVAKKAVKKAIRKPSPEDPS